MPALASTHLRQFVSNARYVTSCQRTPRRLQRRAASNLGCVRAVHVICSGGASRDRTDDPLLAKQVLSQLSYGPVVGLGGLEPPASPLSGVRSNHLSYRPVPHGKRMYAASLVGADMNSAGHLCGRLTGASPVMLERR